MGSRYISYHYTGCNLTAISDDLDNALSQFEFVGDASDNSSSTRQVAKQDNRPVITLPVTGVVTGVAEQPADNKGMLVVCELLYFVVNMSTMSIPCLPSSL